MFVVVESATWEWKRILRWTRFRYSLRTFFVVLTVFCIWLGWQVNIVRERRVLLRQLKEAPAQKEDRASILGDASLGNNEPQRRVLPSVEPVRASPHGSNPVDINFVRRLFGDKSVYSICLPSSLADHRKNFMRVFPEARVYLEPTSELSTPKLIELLIGPHDFDDLIAAQYRVKAIEILIERKAREAIPYLIESINDGGWLWRSDSVGAHAVWGLEAITGHSEQGIDQLNWKKWWKGQTEDAAPQWTDIRSETVSAYWRGLELCVGENSGSVPGWYWIIWEETANRPDKEIARSADSEPSSSESSAKQAAEAAARKALEK